MNSHGSARILPNMPGQDVCVRIIEQPMEKSQRFRYKSEGDTAGSIQGVNSTPENRTYPTIEILNYSGPCALVKVSCVTATTPHRPHPHSLVGPSCQLGICIVEVQSCNVISFPNIGIQQCKVPEFEEKLNQRRALRVNPFGTDDSSAVTYDPKAVCLCFEVWVAYGDKLVRLTPVVSNPIVDKKLYCGTMPHWCPKQSTGTCMFAEGEPFEDKIIEVCNDLLICRLSRSSGCATGGEEVFLLCNCTIGANEDIKVCFSQVRPDGSVWTAFGDFTPQDIHKRYAIVFKTPAYFDLTIQTPVEVMLQLHSAQKYGEPLSFTYIPVNRDPYGILGKRKHKDFPCVRIPDNMQTQAPKLFNFGVPVTSYMPSLINSSSDRNDSFRLFPPMPELTSGAPFGLGLDRLNSSQRIIRPSLHDPVNISNDPRFSCSTPLTTNFARAPTNVSRSSANVNLPPMNVSHASTNVFPHSMNINQHLKNEPRSPVRNSFTPISATFRSGSNVVVSASGSQVHPSFTTINSTDIRDDNLCAGMPPNVLGFCNPSIPRIDGMRLDSRPSGQRMSSFSIPDTAISNHCLMTRINTSTINSPLSGFTSSIRPPLCNAAAISGFTPHSSTRTFSDVIPPGQPTDQMETSQRTTTSVVTSLTKPDLTNRTTVISQNFPSMNSAISDQQKALPAVPNDIQTMRTNSLALINAECATISDEELMNMILMYCPKEGPANSSQIIPSINSEMTNLPTLLAQHNNRQTLQQQLQYGQNDIIEECCCISRSRLLNTEMVHPNEALMNILSEFTPQEAPASPHIQSLGDSEEYIQVPIDAGNTNLTIDSIQNAAELLVQVPIETDYTNVTINSTQNATELSGNLLPDVLQSWLNDIPEYQLKKN